MRRNRSFSVAIAALALACTDSNGGGGIEVPAPTGGAAGVSAAAGGTGGTDGTAGGAAGTGGAGDAGGGVGGAGDGVGGAGGGSGAAAGAGGAPQDGCDSACAADQQCMEGACVCLDGRPICDGVCVDTGFDPNHCGGCNETCDAGEACTAGQCGCGNATASFSVDVLPILTAKCATVGCHAGIRPQAELSLTEATAYAELVGIPTSQCSDGRLRVVPGAPAESYLLDKILGVDLCAGTRMPKAGPPLQPSELEAISAWICAGAPSD